MSVDEGVIRRSRSELDPVPDAAQVAVIRRIGVGGFGYVGRATDAVMSEVGYIRF